MDTDPHLRGWLHERGDIGDRVPYGIADYALSAEEVHGLRHLEAQSKTTPQATAETHNEGQSVGVYIIEFPTKRVPSVVYGTTFVIFLAWV